MLHNEIYVDVYQVDRSDAKLEIVHEAKPMGAAARILQHILEDQVEVQICFEQKRLR